MDVSPFFEALAEKNVRFYEFTSKTAPEKLHGRSFSGNY
jgi:hypothetical protein